MTDHDTVFPDPGSGADNAEPTPAEKHDALLAGQQQAIEILQALAEGRHPFTGEEFAEESVFQHVKVVRALEAAVLALNMEGRKPG